MEILLLVAIMATAASGLYIAATFNKRTEQNTAAEHSHVKLQASNVLGGASMRAARLSPTPVAHVRQPTAKSPPRRIRRQCPCLAEQAAEKLAIATANPGPSEMSTRPGSL